MKYIYRIIFMPVVIVAMIIFNSAIVLGLLLLGNADADWLEERLDKIVMPLIRLME